MNTTHGKMGPSCGACSAPTRESEVLSRLPVLAENAISGRDCAKADLLQHMGHMGHVSQTQLRSRRRGHQTHPRKFRFEGVGVQQKRIALPGQHLRTNQHTNQHTNVTVRDVPVGAGGLRRPTRQLDVCSTNHVPTSPLGPFTQARTRGRHPLQAVHA